MFWFLFAHSTSLRLILLPTASPLSLAEQTKPGTMPWMVAQKMPRGYVLKIKWMLKNAQKVALRCIGCNSLPLPHRCISQPQWCTD